jgi:peptidoglycan/xylan/chitin deacetylase (PgdA/CDA1 family)
VSAALAITVDVDGEAGLANGGAGADRLLTTRSEREYGIRRGLPRILDALAGAPATFYVPGVTAARHPDAVRAILAAGHEVGHHGHTHRRPDRLSPAEQRAEIVLGLEALAAVGVRPNGYRAPGWELTPVTLALLDEHGFGHDSSLMGDDRPYVLEGLVELPVHWSLDDAPYFAASPAGDGLERVWRREVELAAAEDRELTLTLHPEILGRPHRVDVLRSVLALAAELGMPAVTHGELVSRCRPAAPPRSP